MIMYLKNCNLDEFMVHEVIKNNFRLMENLRTVAEKDHYACKSITMQTVFNWCCLRKCIIFDRILPLTVMSLGFTLKSLRKLMMLFIFKIVMLVHVVVV